MTVELLRGNYVWGYLRSSLIINSKFSYRYLALGFINGYTHFGAINTVKAVDLYT
jgi:hypothetical protein